MPVPSRRAREYRGVRAPIDGCAIPVEAESPSCVRLIMGISDSLQETFIIAMIKGSLAKTARAETNRSILSEYNSGLGYHINEMLEGEGCNFR